MSTGLLSPGDGELDEDSLQELYSWIDEIPLSRPKKNITRDFSDGVLIAEIVQHFIPKIIDTHNYSPANAVPLKLTNWGTLNRKVLIKHLNYTVQETTITNVVNCKPGVIEQVLYKIRGKIDKYLAKRKAQELRAKQKMYDDFSPEGPVMDHSGTMYTEDYYTNGPDNNYGYAFNTGPMPMERYPAGPMPPETSGYHPGAPPGKSYAALRQGEAGPMGASPGEDPAKGSSMRLRQRAPSYNTDSKGRLNAPTKGKVPRAQSFQDVSNGDQNNLRLLVEEKEQALLASQETIQILQAKMRRLEHLLHLKDIRIDDLAKRLQQATHPLPRQLPPQQNPPHPMGHAEGGMHPAMMHPQLPHQPPLPPLQHHGQQQMQQQEGYQ